MYPAFNFPNKETDNYVTIASLISHWHKKQIETSIVLLDNDLIKKVWLKLNFSLTWLKLNFSLTFFPRLKRNNKNQVTFQ